MLTSESCFVTTISAFVSSAFLLFSSFEFFIFPYIPTPHKANANIIINIAKTLTILSEFDEPPEFCPEL